MYYAMMRPTRPETEDDFGRERGAHRGWGRKGRGERPDSCGPEGPFMGPRERGGSDEHRGRGEGRGRGGEGRGFGGGHGPMGPGGPGGRFGGHGPTGPGGFGGGFGPGGFGPGGPGFGPGRRGRARRGDVRQAILALLAEQPMNGYQIIQALAERTDGAWKPSPGAIYPALSQLTDEGLVESVEVEGGKAFKLTAAGETAAAEVTTKPWDVVNDESGRNAEGAADLWKEFGSLAMALRSATAAGSPAQLKAASELIAETRRKLFGILAEEQPES